MESDNLTSMPVEFLFKERAQFAGEMHKLPNGPFGSRLLVPAVKGTFEGPRLRGVLLPGLCNDYATDLGNGVVDADAKIAMKTDDGTIILAKEIGRHSSYYQRSSRPGTWRIALTFEVGTSSYQWLNEVVAVGIGKWISKTEFETDIYAVA